MSAPRTLSRCAVMVALNCICAWISLPVGDISFTLQTFSVLLTLVLMYFTDISGNIDHWCLPFIGRRGISGVFRIPGRTWGSAGHFRRIPLGFSRHGSGLLAGLPFLRQIPSARSHDSGTCCLLHLGYFMVYADLSGWLRHRHGTAEMRGAVSLSRRNQACAGLFHDRSAQPDDHIKNRSFSAPVFYYKSSFRSFSLIQPHLRRISQKIQLSTAGRTMQIRPRPIQSMAVMASLAPFATSLTQPVYTPI